MMYTKTQLLILGRILGLADALWVIVIFDGELIYTCKMIQPAIFSRFSQPAHFSRL